MAIFARFDGGRLSFDARLLACYQPDDVLASPTLED